MEKQLLKKLLSYNFYAANKKYVLREFFEGELRLLYDTITKAHEKYKKDLTFEWIRQLFKKDNPASTAAVKLNVANLLDDLLHEEEPPDDIASDIVRDLFEKEQARRIAEVAVEVLNGTKNLKDLSAISNNLELDLENIISYNEIEFNLDEFLNFTNPKNLFQFRHPELQRYIGGAGRGNFAIIFGRPECGKTAFSVFNAAGYLQQGLKVVYFANEEPAKRVYLRLVSSMLECTEYEIRNNIEGTKKAFQQYAKYLNMIECVGMDIIDVDIWAATNKPDIIILDQIDKFRIEGKYNRDDERLGKLYEYAREIAKRNNCLVFGISQCSAEGDGKLQLDFSMLAGSKTAKAAEADLIIGIGLNKQVEEENHHRRFWVSKNKINGWHGCVSAILDKYTVTFKV